MGRGPVLRGRGPDRAAGTLTAILGASGSGKTTLLRVIMGLTERRRRHDRGRRVDGVADGGRLSVRTDRRSIGYVAQDGALFPHVKRRQERRLWPASLRAQNKVSASRETLELVGLHDSYGARRPQELSGGEQRRVALPARSLPAPAWCFWTSPSPPWMPPCESTHVRRFASPGQGGRNGRARHPRSGRGAVDGQRSSGTARGPASCSRRRRPPCTGSRTILASPALWAKPSPCPAMRAAAEPPVRSETSRFASLG